jgi:hypothetical protein
MRRIVAASIALGAFGAACASSSTQPVSQVSSAKTPVSPVQPAPAEWERVVEGAIENRGLAKIERLGDRWALSVICKGIHTTYIHDPPVGLEGRTGEYVSARYRYVDVEVNDPKCVRAPCGPVRERRIVVEQLRKVTRVSDAEAREMERSCVPPRAREREQ